MFIITLLLKEVTNIVNDLHDLITKLFQVFGFNYNDKQLHFIIIGIIGIIIYFITDFLFKKISKLSVSILSFIYTFTVLIVIVFGLEIEQKITSRGHMEFADIVAGIWGFLFLFAIYLLLVGIIYLVKALFKKGKKQGNNSI